ncbi:MAG: glycerol-3-phosphate dehydrogenase/oxidase [Planctomycetaceae bacterium]|nr:glycerol-3-phosphate dehydrogenase/oxidase [Planctomycetaceae bacterium]
MSDTSFQRDQLLSQVDTSDIWDIVIIGGGATGGGIAVDAASRGYRTLLLEQSDFGKGTSSRSTKLIHGGVRYLEQGNLKLVTEALRERERLLHNAPHLVHDLSFVIPTSSRWSRFYYGLGLKAYDWLAGRQSFGRSQKISAGETRNHLPGLKQGIFSGGVLYHDGQFDDARLVINLMQTAVEQGAVTLNYCEVNELRKDSQNRISGVEFVDRESQQNYQVHANCVINATGPFSDAIRRLDDSQAPPLILPSRGIHLVLDRKFLGGSTAMLVPKTRDGRVVFAIPWHDHCVLGTTDTPVSEPLLEPGVSPEEIDFLLETAADYFDPAPTRDDILSTFSGLRPLVNPSGTMKSSKVSREHTLEVSESGLLSIAGGKWTTYREMAEDCVNQAAEVADLPRTPSVTANLKLRGADIDPSSSHHSGEWDTFGGDRRGIDELVKSHPDWGKRLIEEHQLTRAEVIWSVRQEMARTVEDILTRRERILLLNVRVAKLLAEPVADILAEEMGRDPQWRNQQIAEFNKLADSYLPSSD